MMFGCLRHEQGDRRHCRQFVLGVVQSAEGLPLMTRCMPAMSARPRPEPACEQGAGALSGRAGDPGGRPRPAEPGQYRRAQHSRPRRASASWNSSLAVPAAALCRTRRYAGGDGFLHRAGRGQFLPSSARGRPRSDFARPSSRRDAENASRSWKSSPRNWSPNPTRRTKERVSAAAAPPTAAPTAAFSARSGRRTDPLRESRLIRRIVSASASMRKPLLAPSASTANWFWSPTSPTSQRAEIVTRYKEPGGHRTGPECSRATSRSHPYSTVPA